MLYYISVFLLGGTIYNAILVIAGIISLVLGRKAKNPYICFGLGTFINLLLYYGFFRIYDSAADATGVLLETEIIYAAHFVVSFILFLLFINRLYRKSSNAKGEVSHDSLLSQDEGSFGYSEENHHFDESGEAGVNSQIISPVERNNEVDSKLSVIVENSNDIHPYAIPGTDVEYKPIMFYKEQMKTSADNSFCEQCGAPIRDDSVFCHKCGARINRPE